MRLLRIQEVMRLTGLSRMTIYRFEKGGNFPKRRQIGKNSVRWLDCHRRLDRRVDLPCERRLVVRSVFFLAVL
jgi:prophage regulatory protein